MISRDDLIDFIHRTLGQDLLNQAAVKDDLANGPQVLGTDQVTKVALGVSCNQEFLDKAVAWGAQVCIFHHGLDIRFEKFRFPLYTQNRLRAIFQNDLTILGYHYALDAHPTIGNNAQIIQTLGAKITGSLYQDWGFIAEFDQPLTITQLENKCRKLFGQTINFAGKHQHVRIIGVVSGAAKPYQLEIEELLENNVQIYISGESSESTPHKLTELGIGYILGGHYATETFGVKTLGDEIKKHFQHKLKVKFIDIPNLL